jgi:hypothetical protein
VGRIAITLYVFAFCLLVAAAVCLFYGALGSSLRLVWSSIILSGLAAGAGIASVVLGGR